MYIQWCIKGVFGIDDDEARAIIDDGMGLECRWWRNVHRITPPQIRDKLTYANLARHTDRYAKLDSNGIPFCEGTPFISLTAGSVDRYVFLQTNIVTPALITALDFATRGFTVDGYLFYLWTIVGLKPAVPVEAVAEEVRAPNVYHRFSHFQAEGEITAKIHIPANQIRRCDKYNVLANGRLRHANGWPHINRRFADPLLVSNIRELI